TRARARDRGQHLCRVGGARAPDALAHAGRRAPHRRAPGRLEVHLVHGPLARRLRGRVGVPREAPGGLQDEGHRGHAAVLSLVGAPLRRRALALAAASALAIAFALAARGASAATDEGADRVAAGPALVAAVRAGKVVDLTYAFDASTVYWPTEDGFQLEKEHD